MAVGLATADRARSTVVRSFGTGHAAQLRLGIAAIALLLLVGVGVWIAPRAASSVALLRAQDDPAELARLRLPAVVNQDRIAREIDEALQQGDGDLAASFLDLADDQRVMLDPERRRRVETAVGSAGQNAGKDFVDGFASGKSASWFGTAGAIASDLVGVGDLRDLWQEGNKFYEGQPYDAFVLGLSLAGVGLTGVTVATTIGSLGTAAPAGVAVKMPVTKGLNFLKAARRAGFLSRELVERLAGMVRNVVNPASLREAVSAARGLDMAGARRAAQAAIRPDAIRSLERLGGDTVAIEARIGQRGAAQALNAAHDGTELSRIRRLAQAAGSRTRATLKLLGSAAFLLGDIAAALLQAVWLAVGWAIAAAMLARRVGLIAGRLIWVRARRRPVLAGGTSGTPA